MPEQVHELLEQSTWKWPNRPALIDKNGTLEYWQLNEAVDIAANRLRQLGVSPGEGLGVMARNGCAFIVAALAALRCGAILAPIPHYLKRSEMDLLIDSLGLTMALDDGSGITPFAQGSVAAIDMPGAPIRFVRSTKPISKEIVAYPDDTAFVRFTSGTTGKEKGVLISHKSLIDRAAAANRGLRLSHEDIIVWVLPMAFHFCASILLYLSVGAAIAMCKDHLAESIIETANENGGTFLYASPVHYRLLAAAQSAEHLRTLRRAISTLAALPDQTAYRFLERYGIPISQAYGIIEVGLPAINLERAAERPESIGRPLPDYEVALFDDDLRQVSTGTPGQLAVRGPGMFTGYLNPFRSLNETLHDGWFLTGDVARMDADGLLTLGGRCKSVINVCGNKVFPEEVESVLNLHPHVRVSRVSGSRHSQMGEVVHAEVVAQDTTQPPDVEELLTLCRKRLSSYKVPQSVVLVNSIAHTPSGKIRRYERCD